MESKPKAMNKKEVIAETIDPNMAIMEMLAKMQAQLESLQQENKALKTQVDNQPSQTTQSSTSDDFNQLVVIKNMYQGIALTLKIDDNGRAVTLEGVGTTLRKRLVEVLDIYRLNTKFANLGYFVIENKDIVENYFPELIEVYTKTLTADELKNIGKLSDLDLATTYSNSNYIYQRAIVDRFIREWVKGEDNDYLMHSKIQTLTKASGVDIMAMINGVMESESNKKEFSK